MKVAVCYSGLYRHFDGWQKNHRPITDYCDKVVYTTWKGDYPKPKVDNLYTFDEPTITYNSFQSEDIRKNYPRTYKNHYNNPGWKWLSKQVLAHQSACDILSNDIDIVIRMRYDTWIGSRHNWKEYIEKAYNENLVISFGSWSGGMDKQIDLCDKLIIPEKNNEKLKKSLLDFLTIHPKKCMTNAYILHENKILRPANLGWYQVLIESNENQSYLNLGGCVMLTRYRFKEIRHIPGGI